MSRLLITQSLADSCAEAFVAISERTGSLILPLAFPDDGSAALTTSATSSSRVVGAGHYPDPALGIMLGAPGRPIASPFAPGIG